jgi:hypothetical protein
MIFTDSPGEFKAKLERVAPVALPDFTRLYNAIVRSVAKDPRIHFWQPGTDPFDVHYEREKATDIEVERSRFVIKKGGRFLNLLLLAEGSPLHQDYGLVAEATVADDYVPVAEDLGYRLTRTDNKYYVTDTFESKSIHPQELDKLIEEIDTF